MQNGPVSKNNYSLRMVPVLLLTAVLLLVTGLAASRGPSGPPFETAAGAREWLAGFEVRSREDLQELHRACRLILEALPPGPDADGLADLVMTLEDFSAPEAGPGEELLIILFRDSADPAIRRLRDSAGLAPPPGGAVVRIYPTPAGMPPGIRRLFREDTAGITYLTRYIAIWTEGRSEEEVADLLSHELVHAYILTLLGLEAQSLPQWFHEGSALYLSGGKTQYVSHQDYGHTRVSWSPRDYNEWRRAFQYLDRRFGREETERFIRKAVEQRDATRALREVFGMEDYAALARRARRRWMMDQTTRAALILAAIGVAGYLLRLRAARERREMLDPDEIRW